jgi:hypothetical protein
MNQEKFTIELLVRVDGPMLEIKKHSQAQLSPAKSSLSLCCLLSKGATRAHSIALLNKFGLSLT